MNCTYQLNTSSLEYVRKVNDSFALGTLYVMYTGHNPNQTNFEKEAVEDALPSLYNVPIVCNYNPEDRTIGGHDFTVVRDDDDNARIMALTVPCGVVTDHSKFSFVMREDSEGVAHEFLKIDDVVLWRRQDVVKFIEEDLGGKIDHSMEIEVSDGERMEDGYYNIKKFQFTALCLLGNCRPCFDGSELEMYSSSDLKKQVEEMMDDIRLNYSMIVAASEDSGDNTSTSKGGDMEMGNENLENVFTTEGVQEGVEPEVTTEEEPVATVEEPAAVAEPDADAQFSLNSNIRTALFDALRQYKTETPWGYELKFYFVDFDEQKGLVYAEDTENFSLYGIPFSMDGDTAVLDVDAKVRKKWDIVDYVEGSEDDGIFGMFKEFADAATAKITELSGKVESYESESATMSEKFESMESEILGLREFKADIEAKERMANVNAIFAKFTDLEGNECFDALRESCSEMSLADIEDKCYAIRGRLMSQAQLTFSTKAISGKSRIAVGETADDSDTSDSSVGKPYGGIIEKYR